jgi:ABC-type polysaccharide/polyol phosphate transport system ATPase subunit
MPNVDLPILRDKRPKKYMTTPIIEARGIGKVYTLGESEGRDITFREAIKRSIMAPFRRMRELSGGRVADQDFWALREVSFAVAEGEVVGLVGRNGAGKSTLLKILSRITEPSEGSVTLRGRVGALLEVGTGFHPELSGRENVFLNGAILGMKRSEIVRQFDRIVEFAQIGRFLDTPVKRYSSGMYVRLAFAVAAHLEPEILIVDEVLAVGDAEFQRKCLGRMDELRTQKGRTVFLVSHNLEMIESLCTRCIVLNEGRITFDGKTSQALNHYRALGGRGGEITIQSSKRLQWQGVRNRDALRGMRGDSDLTFELSFVTGDRDLDKVHIDIELVDANGRRVTHSKSRFMCNGFDLRAGTPVTFRYTVHAPMLAPGSYFMIVYAYDPGGILAWSENVDACDISSHSYFPAVDFIDEIKATTVPRFEIELLPS